MAKVFADNGFSVLVITSSYNHGTKEYLFSQECQVVNKYKNVHYIYLHSNPAYHTNGVKRVLNMFDFCRHFMKDEGFLKETFGYPDYVIGSSAHPFVWEVAYYISRKYRAKFIAEFRDIWPLSIIQVQGIAPMHPLVLLMSVVEKRAYRRADAVVSTVPDGYKHVCEVVEISSERVFWIPNGINTSKADIDIYNNRSLPDDLTEFLNEQWCCVYAGSLAKCEHISFLIEVFHKYDLSHVNFAIVGNGGEKATLQALINKYSLKNVRMFEAVSKEQIPILLSKSGCCIAALKNIPIYEYGLSMNKLNDYLYSGKPTIFACSVPNVVGKADHFSLPYDDIEGMANTINQVYCLSDKELTELALKAKTLIREEYDYSVLGAKYIKIMEELQHD